MNKKFEEMLFSIEKSKCEQIAFSIQINGYIFIHWFGLLVINPSLLYLYNCQ